jgi:hypothetical protein
MNFLSVVLFLAGLVLGTLWLLTPFFSPDLDECRSVPHEPAPTPAGKPDALPKDGWRALWMDPTTGQWVERHVRDEAEAERFFAQVSARKNGKGAG